ncbi:hypothetical protein ACFQ61_02030 [Streptomyces sp. NPDC056500]|uniref:hypothetical protein n=1 Tax=Streptomyces sp. NPDC056500 TaxID=3345840 RepID=UPI00368EE4CD
MPEHHTARTADAEQPNTLADLVQSARRSILDELNTAAHIAIWPAPAATDPDHAETVAVEVSHSGMSKRSAAYAFRTVADRLEARADASGEAPLDDAALAQADTRNAPRSEPADEQPAPTSKSAQRDALAVALAAAAETSRRTILAEIGRAATPSSGESLRDRMAREATTGPCGRELFTGRPCPEHPRPTPTAPAEPDQAPQTITVDIGIDAKTAAAGVASALRSMVRRPWTITMRCDSCGTRHGSAHTDADASTEEQRAAILTRARIEQGWTLVDGHDYCPNCQPASAEQATAPAEPDPIAYGPTGFQCGCGKNAHSNLVPCAEDTTPPAPTEPYEWTDYEGDTLSVEPYDSQVIGPAACVTAFERYTGNSVTTMVPAAEIPALIAALAALAPKPKPIDLPWTHADHDGDTLTVYPRRGGHTFAIATEENGRRAAAYIRPADVPQLLAAIQTAATTAPQQ